MAGKEGACGDGLLDLVASGWIRRLAAVRGLLFLNGAREVVGAGAARGLLFLDGAREVVGAGAVDRWWQHEVQICAAQIQACVGFFLFFCLF